MKKPILISLLLSIPYCFAGVTTTDQTKRSINDLPIQLIGPLAPFEKNVGWRYGAGIGVEYEAEYHGSDETATELDVYAELAYRTEKWEIQSNILANRFIYQMDDSLFLTGWLNFEEGREADDASDNSLDGMGTVDEMLEYGGGLLWQPIDRLSLGLVAQSYAGGDPDKGLVGFATVHYRFYDTENFKLDISADMSFADADHLQTEFGVTQEQALNSGYDEFQFDSGVKSYGIGFNGVYQFNEQWHVSFNTHYEAYAGDVPDSPIIKAGTESEIEAGVTFVYKFN